MSKIILTGATGFIGTNFLIHLIKNTDYEVLCLGNSRGLQVQEKYFQEYGSERISFAKANLYNLEIAKGIIRDADYVIHMAGRVGNAATVNDLALYVDDILLTANVASAAAENGIKKMLYGSSSTGYKNAEYPIKEEEYFQGQPSYTGYGRMRRYIERLLEHLCEHSELEVIIVRAGAVYGCYDNFDLATCHYVPALIKKYLDKSSDDLKVWGQGKEERDLMFAEDFVAGCMTVFERGKSIDPINVATGYTVSISDVINAITTVAIKKGIKKKKLIFQPEKPVAIPYRCLNVDKLKSLGFGKTQDLITGIEKTIEWYTKDQS